MSLTDMLKKRRSQKVVQPKYDSSLYSICGNCRAKGCTTGTRATTNPPVDVLFIGEMPGNTEDRTGEVFVGDSGEFLQSYLDALEQNDISYGLTNSCRCMMPNKNTLDEDIERCSPWRDAVIALCQPKVVVALGAYALRGFKIAGYESVNKARSVVIQHQINGHKFSLLTTYHPANHIYYVTSRGKDGRQLYDEYERLFGLIVDIVRGDYKIASENITICKSTKEVEEAVAAARLDALKTDNLISLDYELTTWNKDPKRRSYFSPLAEVCSTAFTGNTSDAYVVPPSVMIPSLFDNLLQKRTLLASNVKHEWGIITYKFNQYPDILGFEDTALYKYCLDQSSQENGLKITCMNLLRMDDWSAGVREEIRLTQWAFDLIKKYKGKTNDIEQAKTIMIAAEIPEAVYSKVVHFWDKDWDRPANYGDARPEILRTYNAKDVLYTMRLLLHLRDHYEAPPSYKFSLDMIDFLAYVEQNGLPCDTRIVSKVISKLDNNIKRNHAAFKCIPVVRRIMEDASEMIPIVVKTPVRFDTPGALYDSNKQIHYVEKIQRDRAGMVKMKPKGTPSLVEANYIAPQFKTALAIATDMPVLKETEKGAISIDKKIVAKYAKQDPVWKWVHQLSADSHKISKFLTPFLDNTFEDGRIHAIFNQMRSEKEDADTYGAATGTSTGRLSTEPNIQNHSKDPLISACFQAPPGWAFVAFDYPQIELRLIADIANVKMAKACFRHGIDMHTLAACIAFGNLIPESVEVLGILEEVLNGNLIRLTLLNRLLGVIAEREGKGLRQLAKVANFELAYGMVKQRFAENHEIYLPSMSRMVINSAGDMVEAVSKPEFDMDKVDAVFAAHRRLWKEWYDMVEEYRSALEQSGKMMVHTCFGRARKFEFVGNNSKDNETIRQLSNYRIQPDASDLTLQKACECYQWLMDNGKDDLAQIVNLIHDSPVFIMQVTAIAELVPVMQQILSDKSTLPWDMSVDFSITDFKVGYNLAHTKKFTDTQEAVEWLNTEAVRIGG